MSKRATKLTPADLRRHKRKLKLLEEANGLYADAQEISRQANAHIGDVLEQRLKKIGAFEDHLQEFHEQYGLGPNDRISETGEIIRQEEA